MQNPRAQGPKGLLEKPCGMILPLMNYGNHISRGQCTPNKLRHVFIYIPFFFSFIFWWIYHDGTFLLGNLWDSASRRIIYQDDDKQGAPRQSFLSFISYIYIYISDIVIVFIRSTSQALPGTGSLTSLRSRCQRRGGRGCWSHRCLETADIDLWQGKNQGLIMVNIG